MWWTAEHTPALVLHGFDLFSFSSWPCEVVITWNTRTHMHRASLCNFQWQLVEKHYYSWGSNISLTHTHTHTQLNRLGCHTPITSTDWPYWGAMLWRYRNVWCGLWCNNILTLYQKRICLDTEMASYFCSRFILTILFFSLFFLSGLVSCWENYSNSTFSTWAQSLTTGHNVSDL